MELTARIHIENGSYWADVPELPGCFASGDTLDELFGSLQEGIALYLADEDERHRQHRDHDHGEDDAEEDEGVVFAHLPSNPSVRALM